MPRMDHEFQSPGESKPILLPLVIQDLLVCVHSHNVLLSAPPPTEESRPQIDYVSVASSHPPCRVVREFDGRYQLYCSKGVLDTTVFRAEVIPMARCTPIPMEEWRQAPKVSLRSVALYLPNPSVFCEHRHHFNAPIIRCILSVTF